MPPRRPPPQRPDPADATPADLVIEAIALARDRGDWRGLLSCATALEAVQTGAIAEARAARRAAERDAILDDNADGDA